MTCKPKVLISGWYGASNIGDELLLGAFATWVADGGGELTVISLNPEHTTQVYGFAAVDFHNLGEIALALADCDLFVMGGGGIFQDHHPFHINALYDATALDIAQYARPFYLARQFGVRTLILAHGVGPLASHDAKEIVRDVFTLADVVSVRDEPSAVLLRKIGVTRDILVAADPGWYAAGDAVRASRKDPLASTKLAGNKKLALIVREWQADRQWEDKLVSALNGQLPTGWDCIWVAFQNSLDDSRASSDRPFLQQLSARLDSRINSEIIDHVAVVDAVAAIDECDSVLSMRLHGSILSLALGKPCVFLEYDDKMTQAHNMAQVPDNLRLNLKCSLSNYENVISKLGSFDSSWCIDQHVLQNLQISALEHRKVLTTELEFIRVNGKIRKQWSSQKLDWMSAWLQDLIWQKRVIERASTRAHELLIYRDAQLQEKELHLKEKFLQLDELQSHNLELERDAKEGKQQAIYFKQMYLEQLQLNTKLGDELLKIQELHNNDNELHEFKQNFLGLKAEVIRLQKGLDVQTVLLQTIKNAKQTTGNIMIGSVQNLVRKSQRAIYLLQNGGLRALFSTLKRRRQLRFAQQMPYSSELICKPLSGLNSGSDFFEGAAKIRGEEIVIFSPLSFGSLGEHHHAAQLARAALSAGHRVIYVTKDHRDTVDGIMPQPILGLLQMTLSELSVQQLFTLLSERSVILNFLMDSAILEYLQYAHSRGLKSYFHVSISLINPGCFSVPLLNEFAEIITAFCADTTQAVDYLERASNTPVLYIPNAASHVYFDIYHSYQVPSQFRDGSGAKAVVFAVGEEADIDWVYVERIASLNQNTKFYLLGLFKTFPIMPSNVSMLPEDYLYSANAVIAHSDFLLSPFLKPARDSSRIPQGVYAAAFLNKPIISSQKIVAPQLNNLLYLAGPEELGDLSKRFSIAQNNDLFVSENSWLARLETLVPAVTRNDVSVIILIHNNARIISRCLETLHKHCAPYIKEVIVVDNASSDGGAEIVKQQFPDVKLIINPENGCSSGRNLGVSHASGKYITFFDSDQWFTGGSGFAEALSILESHASVGVIGWNAGWFDVTRTDLGGMIADYCPNRAMNQVAIRDGYRSDVGFLGTSGFFMRRSVFDSIDGFDTYYDPTCFEDTDLCFQIRELGMEISFRDLSGIRHQPHQTTGADGGSERYKTLFLRNSTYFKEKWQHRPDFFIDYSL